MSEQEKQKLRELQAKDKRVKRQEEQFFKDVIERRKEVLERLGAIELSDEQKKTINTNQVVVNEMIRIAKLYEISINELIKYIQSSQQIDFYKRYHPKKEN